MAWLYLGLSLWGAWFSYNALRPSGRHARFGVVSFVAGWLTSELALHHIAWQALATLAFGMAGAFDTGPGRLGLLVTFVSWAGLVMTQRQAHAASACLDAALVEGLGADYQARIEPELCQTRRTEIDWWRVAKPFSFSRPEVEVSKNLQFGREKGLDLKLDVFHHADRPANAPVLLQIHGGAWVIGDKREQALPLMNHMAAQGWVCVSANYRLSPHATFPDHLIDCKHALRWIQEHVAEFGGNPDFVVVTGGSAGGHLAALVGLTANDPEYQPGFEEVDTRVRASVPFYGVYDFTNRNATFPHAGLRELLERRVMKGAVDEIPEAFDRASPIVRVHSDAPPFFALHGEHDTLVPVAEARHFVKALREKSPQPLVYAELPGAQHAFDVFSSVRTFHTVHAVHRFLAYVYSGYLRKVRSA